MLPPLALFSRWHRACIHCSYVCLPPQDHSFRLIPCCWYCALSHCFVYIVTRRSLTFTFVIQPNYFSLLSWNRSLLSSLADGMSCLLGLNARPQALGSIMVPLNTLHRRDDAARTAISHHITHTSSSHGPLTSHYLLHSIYILSLFCSFVSRWLTVQGVVTRPCWCFQLLPWSLVYYLLAWGSTPESSCSKPSLFRTVSLHIIDEFTYLLKIIRRDRSRFGRANPCLSFGHFK
jgi:hypothetical protein